MPRANDTSPKRDPRRDPRPGDVVKISGVGGDIITIETREIRRPNQHEYGLGNVKDYIRYRLRNHPGIQCIQAVSGFRKRAKNAEVIHAAE